MIYLNRAVHLTQFWIHSKPRDISLIYFFNLSPHSTNDSDDKKDEALHKAMGMMLYWMDVPKRKSNNTNFSSRFCWGKWERILHLYSKVFLTETLVINLDINNRRGAKRRSDIIGVSFGHLCQEATNLHSPGVQPRGDIHTPVKMGGLVKVLVSHTWEQRSLGRMGVADARTQHLGYLIAWTKELAPLCSLASSCCPWDLCDAGLVGSLAFAQLAHGHADPHSGLRDCN